MPTGSACLTGSIPPPGAWVSGGRTAGAIIDIGQSPAGAPGGVFEAWLYRLTTETDQLRAQHLVPERSKGNAEGLTLSDRWRFGAPPRSIKSGIGRASDTVGAVMAETMEAGRSAEMFG